MSSLVIGHNVRLASSQKKSAENSPEYSVTTHVLETWGGALTHRVAMHTGTSGDIEDLMGQAHRLMPVGTRHKMKTAARVLPKAPSDTDGGFRVTGWVVKYLLNDERPKEPLLVPYLVGRGEDGNVGIRVTPEDDKDAILRHGDDVIGSIVDTYELTKRESPLGKLVYARYTTQWVLAETHPALLRAVG
jgi:hypothetical protein